MVTIPGDRYLTMFRGSFQVGHIFSNEDIHSSILVCIENNEKTVVAGQRLKGTVKLVIVEEHMQLDNTTKDDGDDDSLASCQQSSRSLAAVGNLASLGFLKNNPLPTAPSLILAVEGMDCCHYLDPAMSVISRTSRFLHFTNLVVGELPAESMKSTKHGVSLVPGEYDISFDVEIPNECPSSFKLGADVEFKRGVSYQVSAALFPRISLRSTSKTIRSTPNLPANIFKVVSAEDHAEQENFAKYKEELEKLIQEEKDGEEKKDEKKKKKKKEKKLPKYVPLNQETVEAEGFTTAFKVVVGTQSPHCIGDEISVSFKLIAMHETHVRSIEVTLLEQDIQRKIAGTLSTTNMLLEATHKPSGSDFDLKKYDLAKAAYNMEKDVCELVSGVAGQDSSEAALGKPASATEKAPTKSLTSKQVMERRRLAVKLRREEQERKKAKAAEAAEKKESEVEEEKDEEEEEEEQEEVKRSSSVALLSGAGTSVLGLGKTLTSAMTSSVDVKTVAKEACWELTFVLPVNKTWASLKTPNEVLEISHTIVVVTDAVPANLKANLRDTASNAIALKSQSSKLEVKLPITLVQVGEA
eukprot:TRINITY_DN591_c4_g1_i3.p1 TRINITY_DN591_c4_g1~~TRINITY_DN591_c4_g1_i3.p1  ORF type:complete len:583 (+),score=178.35 TRINITY_DN591_c4_g1_i3:161-1909(+)